MLTVSIFSDLKKYKFSYCSVFPCAFLPLQSNFVVDRTEQRRLDSLEAHALLGSSDQLLQPFSVCGSLQLFRAFGPFGHAACATKGEKIYIDG